MQQIPDTDKFQNEAMGFLVAFLRKIGSKPFSSEQFTLSAIEQGIAPADLRVFGKVITKARIEGLIQRDPSFVYRRQMGNGSLAIGWRAA